MGKEKTLKISEKKEKARSGYVHTYQCGKIFFTSNFERAWAEQETTISKIKYIVDMYKYDIK